MLSLYQYVAGSVIALVLIFEGYCFWLATYSMYKGYEIAVQHNLTEIKQHGLIAIALSAMAISIWALDILTCDLFLDRFQWIPHWHAWWHVLTAIGFHETAQIQMYLFLKKIKQRPRFVTCCRLIVEVKCAARPRALST